MYHTYGLQFLRILWLLGPWFRTFILLPCGFRFGLRVVMGFFLITTFTSSFWSCLRASSSILSRVIRISSENSFVLCLKVFLKFFYSEDKLSITKKLKLLIKCIPSLIISLAILYNSCDWVYTDLSAVIWYHKYRLIAYFLDSTSLVLYFFFNASQTSFVVDMGL